jgi:hypothetical protein
MSRLIKSGLCTIVLATSALLLGGLAGARADTIFDLLDCNNHCGPAGTIYGTVDVNLVGQTITFNLTYPGWQINDPDNASVGFNITGVTGVSIDSSSPSPASDWDAGMVFGLGSPPAPEGDIDGQNGDFRDYIDCKSTCGTKVILDFTGSGFTLTNNNDSAFASVDVVDGSNNSVWGTELSEVATPLPATLPLFAGGLGFVGCLAKRRKQTVKQSFAVA